MCSGTLQLPWDFPFASLKRDSLFAGADAEEDPLWVVWRMVGWGKGVWEGDDRRPWVLPFKPQFGGVEE